MIPTYKYTGVEGGTKIAINWSGFRLKQKNPSNFGKMCTEVLE